MLDRDQPLEPPALLRLGHRLRPAPRAGVGSRRVLEQERAVVADLAQQGHGALEVLLGLAREAHDDVGAERDPGDARAQRGDDLAVALDRVGALHRREHAIRARLERQVHVGAELRAPGVRGDQALGDVRGVGRGVADPLQALDLVRGAHQVGEVALAVAPRVHGLAQEHHLAEAARDRAAHVGEQGLERQAALASACVGHHAVGAELVATALHRDPGAHARRAPRLEVAVGLVAVEPHAGDRRARRVPQQLGKRAVAVGPHHQVEHPRFVEQALAQVLGHAAGHAHHQARALALEAGELAQPAQHALLGMLPDRAGVEDHRVGVLGALHQRQAGALEHARHHLAVRHVHLAAVGLEEHALHGPAA